MLSDIRCEECGQALDKDDLTCWACGALTERGKRQKRGESEPPTTEADTDEAWRQSVEAAKRRRQTEPPVDPDEALQQVLAQQGAVEELARVTEAAAPTYQRERSEYPALRLLSGSLNYVAMGAAAIFAVMAVIILAYSLSLFGQESKLAPLIGFGAAVFTGVMAMLVYYVFRVMGEAVGAMADAADNSRRTVVVLRMLHKQMQQQSTEGKPEGE